LLGALGSAYAPGVLLLLGLTVFVLACWAAYSLGMKHGVRSVVRELDAQRVAAVNGHHRELEAALDEYAEANVDNWYRIRIETVRNVLLKSTGGDGTCGAVSRLSDAQIGEALASELWTLTEARVDLPSNFERASRAISLRKRDQAQKKLERTWEQRPAVELLARVGIQTAMQARGTEALLMNLGDTEVTAGAATAVAAEAGKQPEEQVQGFSVDLEPDVVREALMLRDAAMPAM
jgi:hypothetical protein